MKAQLHFHGQNKEYSFALILREKTIKGSGRVVVRPEYYGLIKGLEKALSIGVKEIAVYGDCKTVVEQIKKNKPSPLTRRVRILLSNFETAEVHWIPREKNKADEVVREEVEIKDSDIKRLRNGIYLVSGSYIVNLHNNTCTCPEFVMKNRDYLTGKTKKAKDCIHLKAVKKQAKEEVVK